MVLRMQHEMNNSNDGRCKLNKLLLFGVMVYMVVVIEGVNFIELLIFGVMVFMVVVIEGGNFIELLWFGVI